MHDFEPFVLPALQNSEILPVPRNISAGLQITARRIFARNKFAAGDYFRQKSAGGENNVAPLEIKSPPEQLEHRFNKSPNIDMQKS